MKLDKERWNARLLYEKLCSVAGFVCFLAFLVFDVLKLMDRLGILTLGFDPSVMIGLLLTAWQACEIAVDWRTNHETAQYTLFCHVFLGGLGAMLVIVWLFVNL